MQDIEKYEQIFGFTRVRTESCISFIQEARFIATNKFNFDTKVACFCEDRPAAWATATWLETTVGRCKTRVATFCSILIIIRQLTTVEYSLNGPRQYCSINIKALEERKHVDWLQEASVTETRPAQISCCITNGSRCKRDIRKQFDINCVSDQ